MRRPASFHPASLRPGGSTRRQFLGRGAVVIGGVLFAPSVLAACSDDDEEAAGSCTAAAGGEPGSTLRISNWPLYMADGFVDEFAAASGFDLSYQEDFNDNEQWFAKVNTPLKDCQDIGADLVVPTEFMVGRLMTLQYLTAIDAAKVPNKANLRPDLLESPVDPGRAYSLPYMSGMVGLAYNRAETDRDITSVDDLWDPAFSGRVSLFSDFRDGLGMVMLSQGNDPSSPTTETVQQAIDKVAEEKEKGQIRRFTGNDYAEDLAAGNIIIAQAYSGDVVQLQADNPDLQFVVPEAGGTTFVDCMIIPNTSRNKVAAEAWMDYIYDRANYAKLVDFVQYVPVLSDMTDELDKINPDLSADPLINPPADVLARLYSWPSIPEQDEQAWNQAYTEVTSA